MALRASQTIHFNRDRFTAIRFVDGKVRIGRIRATTRVTGNHTRIRVTAPTDMKEPDEDNSVNSEELFISTIMLPHYVAPWQNTDVDDRLTMVVWMPVGGYK